MDHSPATPEEHEVLQSNDDIAQDVPDVAGEETAVEELIEQQHEDASTSSPSPSSSTTPATTSPAAKSAKKSQEKHLAERREVFHVLGQHAWDIVMWKDPIRSGIFLGASLAYVLFSTFFLSSMLQYIMATFTFSTITTVGVVGALSVFQSVTKAEPHNPLAAFVPRAKLAVSHDDAVYYAEVLVTVVNTLSQEVAKIVLVDSLVHSTKAAAVGYFGWLLASYIPTSVLALITILGVFTLPMLYMQNEELIVKQWTILTRIYHQEMAKLQEKMDPYWKKFQATITGQKATGAAKKKQ